MITALKITRLLIPLLLLGTISPAPEPWRNQQPAASDQQAAAPQPRRDSHLIMISVDGLMPETYTSPGVLGLNVPNLVRMKLNGSYADGVEGVFPSVTYPSHTTMVTGVRPAVHGIINNGIFEAPTERQTGSWYWYTEAIKSRTLWMLAREKGLVTAAVGWPVTVGAQFDYLMPEVWDPAERPRTAAATIKVSTPQLVEKSMAAAGLTTVPSSDVRRMAVAEYIIKNYKPNLLLLHLVDLDDVQHTYGARSKEAIAGVEKQDAFIGRIIEAAKAAGILEKTTFVIVSDHGFAKVEKRFEPNVVLAKEKLIDVDASGKVTDWKAAAWISGGSCAIVLKNADDKETEKRVAQVFRGLASGNGAPINRVLDRRAITRLAAVPNAVLMLDAAPGFTFGGEITGPAIHETENYRGTHGQLPSRPEMRSTLIVYGSAARTGARIPLARMIDIAPTAAAVLGLRFEEIEGRPMAELLRPGTVPPAAPRKKK